MVLASMTWTQMLLSLVLLGVCGFLILVILLQRGRGGGLAGAFGGAGGSSAFGAKTGDVFTWITVVVATIFVLLNIVGNFVFDESRLVQANPATVTAPEPLPAPTIPAPTGDAPTQTIPVEVVPVPAPVDGAETAPKTSDQPPATAPPEEPSAGSDSANSPSEGGKSDSPEGDPAPKAE